MKKDKIIEMFVDEWKMPKRSSALMDRRISNISNGAMQHLSIYKPIEIDNKNYRPVINKKESSLSENTCLTFTEQYGFYKKAKSTCDIKEKTNCTFENVDFEKLSGISDEIYL